MKEDLYLNTLTNICEFIVGTSQMVNAGGKGYKGGKSIVQDREPPERGGYPVVISLKERTTTCDWCQEEVPCPNLKTYSRPVMSSPIWEGKCQECGQRRIIQPKE